MKSKLVLCSMVLGCSMGLMAQQNSNAPGATPPTFPQDQSQQQTTQPSSSPTAAPDASQQSSQTGQMDKSADKQKVEGCLSGTDGNFTLTDKSGMTYQLQGENSELAKHVNQEVRIEGMASAAGSASAPSGASSAAGGSTLTVSKVKKVSDNCAANPNSGGAPPKSY